MTIETKEKGSLVTPELRERLRNLRSEETISVAFSPDGKQVNVVRCWLREPTYQLEGPVGSIDEIFDSVLPRSRYRDERGHEPATNFVLSSDSPKALAVFSMVST